MAMRGCWSCGSHGACYADCECAKCVDPEGYAEWRAHEHCFHVYMLRTVAPGGRFHNPESGDGTKRNVG